MTVSHLAGKEKQQSTYIFPPSENSMRQKNALNDEEWTGWLHWMKNCFKYGSIG